MGRNFHLPGPYSKANRRFHILECASRCHNPQKIIQVASFSRLNHPAGVDAVSSAVNPVDFALHRRKVSLCWACFVLERSQFAEYIGHSSDVPDV